MATTVIVTTSTKSICSQSLRRKVLGLFFLRSRTLARLVAVLLLAYHLLHLLVEIKIHPKIYANASHEGKIHKMLKNSNTIEPFNDDKVFRSLDLSQASCIGCSFNNCTFEHCTFIDSSWRTAQFHSCTFISCNINFVQLEGCLLQDVVFQECKLVGLEFCKCNKTFLSISIKQCVLLNCNVSDLDLRKTSFHKSNLKDCSFTNTNLTEADFTNTDLLGSIFHQCKLDKADFRNAKNYSINPHANTVKKAKFSYPEVLTLLAPLEIIIE